ncbi:hypothetical protein ILYODFUR_029976 [Ilyodon furcidens]|uniref:Uncharacterized protein n=1 Tax=Ilyodon furcidens TaxID=33524 RepID=A0ABV0T1D9_9TELE
MEPVTLSLRQNLAHPAEETHFNQLLSGTYFLLQTTGEDWNIDRELHLSAFDLHSMKTLIFFPSPAQPCHHSYTRHSSRWMRPKQRFLHSTVFGENQTKHISTVVEGW